MYRISRYLYIVIFHSVTHREWRDYVQDFTIIIYSYISFGYSSRVDGLCTGFHDTYT